MSVWICGTYVVNHFNGTGLRYHPPSSLNDRTIVTTGGVSGALMQRQRGAGGALMPRHFNFGNKIIQGEASFSAARNNLLTPSLPHVSFGKEHEKTF